jgi:hypothetical protein
VAKDNFHATAQNNTFQAMTPEQQQAAYAQALQGSINQQAGLGATAAQGFQTGMAGSQAAGAGQDALISQLQGQAAGTSGPNLGQQQLTSGLSQAQNQAAGQIAATQGTMDPAQQQRLILENQASQAQTAAGQGASINAQQQLASQQQLAAALQAKQQGAQAQAGLGANVIGGTTSTLGSQQNAANQTAAGVSLGTQGLNETAALANQQAAIDAQHINANVAASNASSVNGMVGGLVQGAAGAASMFSDERLKDVKGDGGGELEDFLRAARPEAYKYKGGVQEAAGDGEYVTPMAQRLEKSKLGRDLVRDTPAGKVVDYGKAMGTVTGAVAHVNKKVNGLAAALKAKGMAAGGMVDALPSFVSNPSVPGAPAATDAGSAPADVNSSLGKGIDSAMTAGAAAKGKRDARHAADIDVANAPYKAQALAANAAPMPSTGFSDGGIVQDAHALVQAAHRLKQRMSGGGTVKEGVDLTDAARLDEATRKEGDANRKAELERQRQAAVNNGGQQPEGSKPIPQGYDEGGEVQRLDDEGGTSDTRSPYNPHLPGMWDETEAPAQTFRHGGPVPGRPKVDGDSPKNDTVPAMLSPGEVVLPRSVANDPEAPDKAAKFVASLKGRRAPKGRGMGYGGVVASARAHAERCSQIEAMRR